MVKIAPYGTWTSPIGAADVAALGGTPQWVGLVGGRPWWALPKPAEGGRLALCRLTGDGRVEEVLPAPWNARNRVHEYGGRPWLAIGDRIVFTHWDDQRWYVFDANGPADPKPISPAPAREQGLRYADPAASPDGTELWCVRESVTGDRPTDVERHLVAVPLSGAAADDPAAVRVLAGSHRFLTGPRPSPDGRRVAWLGWNHPAMPWDGTELCVADIAADGTFGPHRVVAGGPAEAVCQVDWDGDALLALTDPDGWWNLFRVDPTGTGPAVNLAPTPAEIGGPMWQLGHRWFTPVGNDRYAVVSDGRLALLDATAGTVMDMAGDMTGDLPMWQAELVASGDALFGVAGSATRDAAVVRVDLAGGTTTELTPQPAGMPDPAYLPTPRARTITDAAGQSVPAYLFLPANPDFQAPDGEAPPLLVTVHGGPTGAFTPRFNASIAYFTSRGFAVAGVNYGGSTGYGREFRERLLGQWGVVDVADCAAVAEALAAEGTVDGQRMAVRGGSAGGWTSAASLTSVRTYRCGTVMFPILDATGWTADGGETHDFESRYIENLIGSLPEHADRYAERSPALHADRLAGPVLLLQGLEDEICPPVQADEFVAGLHGTGIPHAYLTFEGEQHGFRKAESIKAALEAELSFYGQVFGFTTPGVPTLELQH
ncbi:MAG TPA: prolyl oligopeptidase family serine peptidase [Pseudonocardiaceae bacterium]|nr:prolyl oligopeptidase family serine peptidase [Pseudonocardiaceae bacterium]